MRPAVEGEKAAAALAALLEVWAVAALVPEAAADEVREALEADADKAAADEAEDEAEELAREDDEAAEEEAEAGALLVEAAPVEPEAEVPRQELSDEGRTTRGEA